MSGCQVTLSTFLFKCHSNVWTQVI